MKLQSAAISQKGLESDLNQDAILEDPDRGLFAVADGVGGYDDGELASAIAIETLARELAEPLYDDMLAGRTEGLRQAFLRANVAIMTASIRRGRRMRTTLTAVLLGPRTVIVAHSGDSRAYLITPGEVECLTEDHTLVGDMVRDETMTEERARNHPRRNVLTGCLGIHERFKLQTGSHPLPCGSKLVLCTDGVGGYLSEERIASIVRSGWELDRVALELVEAAQAEHSPDDRSVVVIADC